MYIYLFFFPLGKCQAGHICLGRAEWKDPAFVKGKLEWGRRCTAGYYCEEGATYEVPCPEGTYR